MKHMKILVKKIHSNFRLMLTFGVKKKTTTQENVIKEVRKLSGKLFVVFELYKNRWKPSPSNIPIC